MKNIALSLALGVCWMVAGCFDVAVAQPGMPGQPGMVGQPGMEEEEVGSWNADFKLKQDVTCVAINSDDTLIAAGSKGEIALFDIATKKVKRTITLASWATNLSFSPDGRWLIASELGDARLRAWDLGSGSAASRDIPLAFPATALGWSPEGQTLLVAAQKQIILLPLDFVADKSQTAIPATAIFDKSVLQHPVYAIRMAADGKITTAGGGYNPAQRRGDAMEVPTEGQIVVFGAGMTADVYNKAVPGGSPNCAVSPDGQIVAFTGGYVTLSEFYAVPKSTYYPTTWRTTYLQMWTLPKADSIAKVPFKKIGALKGPVKEGEEDPDTVYFGNGAATTALEPNQDELGNKILPTQGLSISAKKMLAVASGNSPQVALWTGYSEFGQTMIETPKESPASVLAWSEKSAIVVATGSRVCFYRSPLR